MKLHFLTPSKTIFDGEVTSVTIPGTKGLFTVLTDHAPLLTTIEKGLVEYTIGESEKIEVIVGGGFAEVKNNVVTICAEKILEAEK